MPPLLLLALLAPGASSDAKTSITFPASGAVIDITRPPYNARGDGKTDDTKALQKALDDMMGQHKILYLPNGTYLIAKPLRWAKKNAKKQDAWGFNWIQGQNTTKTIIRLKDNTFTDAKSPRAIMWCGGFGSADWFHNYIQNVTFNTGKGNSGAIGLQFYSNNTGAVRDVAIVSEDGKGAIGLDLAPADMNGPLLVQRVSVKGFQTGIRCGASVNSQTLEHISLTGQSNVGLVNGGQSVSVRGLTFAGEVTAVDARSFTVLIDSTLTGKGAAKKVLAVKAGKSPIFLRNITTSGFKAAVEADGKSQTGPKVAEFMQGAASNPFKAAVKSLNLTIKDTPQVPWDNPKTWAVVDTYGADPTGVKDSSAAIQKAIDSGATTVFFPGFYNLKSPVKVRGKVRRLLGCGAWLDYNGNSKPDLIIADGDAKVVVIEHFAPINGGVVVDTARTVVFRSLEARSIVFKKKGDAFFEDVATNDLKINKGQRAWARQLNIENQGTHLTNAGGTLWVLGYKTERGGTLLKTTDGGSSEVLGNFSYTTTAGKLAPMFVTRDARVFAFFNEVCYSGDPFATLIQETRGKETKTVKRGAGWIAPYVSGGGK